MLARLAILCLFALVLSPALAQVDEPDTFSWSNCGSSSDPTKIVNLVVTPDPIVLGQSVTITFKALLSTTINPAAAISASVVVQKQLFGYWIDVPCLENIGSCNYTNVCTAWDLFLQSTNLCPVLKQYNIPCACALAAGTYALGPVSHVLPNPGISWLSGPIRLSIQANNADGSRLFCTLITATISVP